MIELGQLEAHHEAFAERGVRVVAISNDDLETARLTQDDFPHLVVVSDAEQKAAKAVEMIHPGMGPGGSDTNAPTTLLVDERGVVRWIRRPARYLNRLAPKDLLAAIDETWPSG